MCRVFSAAPERQATPDILAAYETEVAGTQISKADLGGYKVGATANTCCCFSSVFSLQHLLMRVKSG